MIQNGKADFCRFHEIGSDWLISFCFEKSIRSMEQILFCGSYLFLESLWQLEEHTD